MDTVRAASDILPILGLSSLELHLRPEWGADSVNHRDLIRQDLHARQTSLGQHGDSSISHARGLGGYVLLPSANPDLRVGLDVETVLRISPDVARRICKEEREYGVAPSPASLWCAKEAAYKSLKGPMQPLTVMQIEITDWKRVGGLETFRFHCPANPELPCGQGATWSHEGFQLALAVAPAFAGTSTSST